MKVNKEIKASQKHINQLFTIAIVMIVLGLIVMSLGLYQLIGFGVLTLVVAFMTQNLTLVKLLDNHMELKLGPFAGTKYVKFCDVHDLKKESAKKIYIHYKNGESQKKIRIPVHMIEENDLIELMSVISKHTKS